MTAALLGPAFFKAADTLCDKLNQQLIQKSAAGGGALFWKALPAQDPITTQTSTSFSSPSIPHFNNTVAWFLRDAPYNQIKY